MSGFKKNIRGESYRRLAGQGIQQKFHPW